MADKSDAADDRAPVRIEIEIGGDQTLDAAIAGGADSGARASRAVVGIGLLMALLSFGALFMLRPDPDKTADGAGRTSTTVPGPSTTVPTTTTATTAIVPKDPNQIEVEAIRGLIDAQSIVETNIGYVALGYGSEGPPRIRRSIDGVVWQFAATSLGPEVLALVDGEAITDYQSLIQTSDGFALIAYVQTIDGDGGAGSVVRLRSDAGAEWTIDHEFPIYQFGNVALTIASHTPSTIALIGESGINESEVLALLNNELRAGQQIDDGCWVERRSPSVLVVFSCAGGSSTVISSEELKEPSRSELVFGCAAQLAETTAPFSDKSLVIIERGQETQHKAGPSAGWRGPGITIDDSFVLLQERNRLADADYTRCDGLVELAPLTEAEILVWEGNATEPRHIELPEEPSQRSSALLQMPDPEHVLFIGVSRVWSLDIATSQFSSVLTLPDSANVMAQTYIATDHPRLVHVDEARLFIVDLDQLPSSSEQVQWSQLDLSTRNGVRFVNHATARQLIALNDFGFISIPIPEILEVSLAPGQAEPRNIGDAALTPLNTRVALQSITGTGGGYLALGAAADVEGPLAPNILVSADGAAWVTIPTGLSGIDLIEEQADQRVTRSFAGLSTLENQLVVSMVEVLSDRSSGEIERTVVTRLASVDGRAWTGDSEFTPFEVAEGDVYPIRNTSDTFAISVVSQDVGHPLIELVVSLEVTDPAIANGCWAEAKQAVGTGTAAEGRAVIRLVPCDGSDPVVVVPSQLTSPDLAVDFTNCLLQLNGRQGPPLGALVQRRDFFTEQFDDIGVVGTWPITAPDDGSLVVLHPSRAIADVPFCGVFDSGVPQGSRDAGVVILKSSGNGVFHPVPESLRSRHIFGLAQPLVATEQNILVPAGDEVYAVDRVSGAWSVVMTAPEPRHEIWPSPDGQLLFAIDGPRLLVAEPWGQWLALDIGTPFRAESMIYADNERAFFLTAGGPFVIDLPDLTALD